MNQEILDEYRRAVNQVNTEAAFRMNSAVNRLAEIPLGEPTQEAERLVAEAVAAFIAAHNRASAARAAMLASINTN